MKANELTERYFKDRASAGIHYGKYPFVTISREAGAGGHALAEAILSKLEDTKYERLHHGWKKFDQEICDILDSDPNIHVSMQELITEEYHSQSVEFFNQLFGLHADQGKMLKETFMTLRTLAGIGKVILVGRGGVCVTRSLPGGIHVRLVAPESTRVKRMAETLHIDTPSAFLTIEKQDNDRKRLVRDCFKEDIDDPLLYDVVWNTRDVAVEEMANSVVRLIDERYVHQQKGEALAK